MPTDSLRERLLSPTSPGNLKKLTIQFPPSPTIPTRKQKPLNVSQMILRAMIPLLGFIIFVIAIWIYFLYAGFNYQSPSQGSGHEFTSSIIFKGIQNASILSSPPTKHLKDMKYCESGCMYFNPTLTFYNGQYIFAVRESSRQNCFGILGTILTLWKLFRPAISSVLIGVLPHDQRMDSQQTKTVNIDYRIPDYHLFNPNEYHNGFEDPRFIVDKGRLFVLMAAERHWRPRLFLMQISDGMDKETYHHNPSAPIELELFGPTVSYGQKNWMHIPSEMEADLDLLFIYKIVPLCVVKTNPITGQTMIEYEAAQSISSSPYKGSSGFIPLSDADYQAHVIDKDQYQKHFIAIVHTTKSNEFDRTHPSSVHLPRFKITHLSENYTFFSDNKGKLAARINYPTSIVDVDGYYLIPFGEMDCESFLARVDKTKVLRSMKLVDLQ